LKFRFEFRKFRWIKDKKIREALILITWWKKQQTFWYQTDLLFVAFWEKLEEIGIDRWFSWILIRKRQVRTIEFFLLVTHKVFTDQNLMQGQMRENRAKLSFEIGIFSWVKNKTHLFLWKKTLWFNEPNRNTFLVGKTCPTFESSIYKQDKDLFDGTFHLFSIFLSFHSTTPHNFVSDSFKMAER
jgi:hypothetical protein